MTLVLRYAVRSDVGLLREGNEDSAYAGPRLLAVADGMGGHAAGEVASALTIASMSELDSEQPSGDMLTALASAVTTANARLQEKIIANPAVEGMGTTLTALLWSDGHAALCHIGDSRGYLLRQGELYQITHDHTLVQSLVDEGRISVDDVSTHPQRSLLLRALDGRSAAEPDLSVHDALPGDRYLLCSDGLSGVVSDETLRDTLEAVAEPDAATRELIDLANAGGGPDNITCIVADVVDTATTRLPLPSAPMLAGAAAIPGSLKLAADGNDPFGDLDDDHGRAPRSVTAMHTIMFDDDLDPRNPGTIPLAAASENGAGLGTAPARRSHRAQPRRPRRSSGRRRWPIVTVSLLVLVAILAVGGFIGLQLTQGQYYLASTNGQIVIYQGVNQQILWYKLYHVYQQTGIELAQVPTNDQQTVSSYPPGNLAHAQSSVANIRAAVTQCQQQYTQLRDWVTRDNRYLAEVALAHKNKKPTTHIAKPGTEPTVGPFCQPSEVFGIPASDLSPTPAGTS
ncbi:MAG: PP2C family protein-serine/threonine phosphatase [Streptosporangiaceae bacterium]